MADAPGYSWESLLFPVLVTGLSVWLAYGAITTGMAGYHENRGDGDRALSWRATSPLALALKAERLTSVQDYEAADVLARQALRRSSLRADALRTLALSASARSRAGEALTLMSRAGRLNPRDDQTRGWLFERAVARGDYRRAVFHADALMRRSPQTQAPLSSTLVTLLADSEARSVLAGRLAVDPPWRGRFLSVAARKGDDADVAALYQALKRTAAPATDAETSAFFGRLVAARRYQLAKVYFEALVDSPTGPTALVYDGGFAGRPGSPPLNWQVMPVLGGSARWTADDGAPLGSLLVNHDGFSSSGAVLRQLVLLSPGAYEVSARARLDDPAADGRFKVQIVCAAGSRLVSMTLRGAPGSWVASQARFAVPEACEAQWLLITPTTGDRREMVELSIDDIVIRPAATLALQPGEPDRNQ